MQPATERRHRLIRLIHVAKRDRKLDEESYRDRLHRATGKRSAADMSEAELDEALKSLKEIGFKVQRAVKTEEAKPEQRRRHRLREGQKALATALWISLWQLGAVRDNKDSALDAFVERQTKIPHLQWLGPQQAHRVIEALKDWCGREGFEVPAYDEHERPAGIRAKRALVHAIWRKLKAAGAAQSNPGDPDYAEIVTRNTLGPDALQALADRLGFRLRAAEQEA